MPDGGAGDWGYWQSGEGAVKVRFICAQCGAVGKKERGAFNRSRSIDAPLYCDRTCAGLARRQHKSQEQRVAEKAEYDAVYRTNNVAMLKAKRQAYHRATYDPGEAAVKRKVRMPRHVEYCRRPEYRAKKSVYDRKYRAGRIYGPFAEAFLALIEVNQEIAERMSDYEVRLANGTFGKTQQRKRDAAAHR